MIPFNKTLGLGEELLNLFSAIHVKQPAGIQYFCLNQHGQRRTLTHHGNKNTEVPNFLRMCTQ